MAVRFGIEPPPPCWRILATRTCFISFGCASLPSRSPRHRVQAPRQPAPRQRDVYLRCGREPRERPAVLRCVPAAGPALSQPVCTRESHAALARLPLILAPTVASISASAGDYTQGWIKSVDDLTYGDERTEAVDAFPVEIRHSPRGLIYVDHTHGMVRSIALNAADTPFSPSSSPAPPFARIINPANMSLVWAAGSLNSSVFFLSEQNVEGREGANYNWTVALNYACNAHSDSCLSMPLFSTGELGGRNLTIPSQYLRYPGTIEVTLEVRSYKGFGAVAQRAFAASSGSSICTCSGNRTITGAYLTTPSPRAAKPKSSSTVDTKSALFIGLVAGFSTLVAIGAVAAAMFFTGGFAALARFGSSEGLSRLLRRPGTGSNAGFASADSATGEPRTLLVAATAVPAAADSPPAADKPTSSVAARRSANITPLDDSNDGAAASAPSRPSPADKAGQTPSGSKRV